MPNLLPLTQAHKGFGAALEVFPAQGTGKCSDYPDKAYSTTWLYSGLRIWIASIIQLRQYYAESLTRTGPWRYHAVRGRKRRPRDSDVP